MGQELHVEVDTTLLLAHSHWKNSKYNNSTIKFSFENFSLQSTTRIFHV